MQAIRRFSDFEWLHDRLSELLPGAILPVLPDKNVMQKLQPSREFVEERRKALEVFLSRMALHPLAGPSPELMHFLVDSEDAWVGQPQVACCDRAVRMH